MKFIINELIYIMINLIACVVQIHNKLCIGKDGDLIFKLRDDLAFFKDLTSFSLHKDSKLELNIVLMGHKTYYSIPQTYRPLKNRINFVLTNNKRLHTKFDVATNGPFFMNIATFKKIYKEFTPNVFVIGGGQVYNYFLSDESLRPEKLYITEVKGYNSVKTNNYTYMDHFDYKYRLVGFTKQCTLDNLTYRTLYYNYDANFVSEEYKYLDLAKNILENGKERIDRTGVGTISTFGQQLRFDISNGTLPLLTTKKVGLKAVIEELLFFCRGDSDTKILERKGVKIWNGNTTREFLDKRGLSYSEGIMGPMYGPNFRNFGAEYSESLADTSKINTSIAFTGFDQLSHVEHLLKTDPFSRRIYISNLNPAESKNMVLEPCHTYFQLYVEEINNEKYLSGYFTMRSSDFFLAAVSYNTISYSLLVYILAMRCGMKPKEIIYNAVDVHLYKNHLLQVKEQLTKTPRPFPKIKLNNSLKSKDWSEMTFEDFEIIGYFPHEQIKALMAI